MENEGKELNIPQCFSGAAQLLLYTRYDDPRIAGWEQKWITEWNVQLVHPWFPERTIKIHKHFWPLFNDALTELELLGLDSEIKSCDSTFSSVHYADSPVLSVHSWGVAIDMNAADNPVGSAGKWSEDFIAVMMRHGIYCGQNWTGNKEPMHFAMVDG